MRELRIIRLRGPHSSHTTRVHPEERENVPRKDANPARVSWPGTHRPAPERVSWPRGDRGRLVKYNTLSWLPPQ